MDEKKLFEAAITLYNPTDEQIQRAISYSQTFDYVILLDNSDEYFDNNTLIIDMLNERCKYIRMSGNEGLSVAFNKALETPEVEKCDYLCTLDQDSIFEQSQIRNLMNFISNTYINLDEVGIFAPIIDYGKGQKKSENFEERKRVITSGSFVSLRNVKKFNIIYDIKYFIDKFEIDFCQQLLDKKLKIIVYHGAVLKQRLGDEGNFGHSCHSVLRHYYLFRNRFYFNHKFFPIYKRYLLNILQTARHCVFILLYEPQKVMKVKMLKLASQDYLNGKMGKYEKKG